jgi:transposase
MAPHLAKAQVALITGMLSSGLFTNSEIATAANCSTRGVRRISSNIRYYGAPQAPRNGGGRKRSITPAMLDALCEHSLEKPGLYQSEMILFLMNEFDVLVTASSIGRTLRSRGWTKKQIRRIANGRNADLRDHYLYQISSLSPEQFVFVDESGCDKRIGFRRTGWSPIGATPVQIARFQREQRYQILPAYIVDGVIFSRIFQGTIDSEFFEDFIEQLLPLCGRWPEPKSVLVMDNAPSPRPKSGGRGIVIRVTSSLVVAANNLVHACPRSRSTPNFSIIADLSVSVNSSLTSPTGYEAGMPCVQEVAHSASSRQSLGLMPAKPSKMTSFNQRCPQRNMIIFRYV